MCSRALPHRQSRPDEPLCPAVLHNPSKNRLRRHQPPSSWLQSPRAWCGESQEKLHLCARYACGPRGLPVRAMSSVRLSKGQFSTYSFGHTRTSSTSETRMVVQSAVRLTHPFTACLAAEYPAVPGPLIIEFTDAQFTMEPCCSGRPSSLGQVYQFRPHTTTYQRILTPRSNSA